MNYCVLVNRDNKIKDNYLDKVKLINTKNIDDEEIKVEENTYKAYLELKEFLESINITIGLNEGYREVSYQEELFNRFTIDKGIEYTITHVAEPRFSEHHTALALDISILIDKEYTDEDHFEVFEEIHKHLHKFGFILRYPKGKEIITKYSYEPWHIRYVGKIPAKIIYENNLTLEEYLTSFGGVLYINKPKNITSFDVVNKISHILGIKKVGHTGTLDPMATGVMLVAFGKATKIVELLTFNDKEYIAGVELGYKTDTYDNTGKVINRCEIRNDINIKETLNSYKKTYLQEVPIYSAVKVNGKKLYEYAREEKSIELPKKEVTIKEIELLEEDNNTFKFKALVSKGTYIRSLINDIGISLNTYATMTSLERIKQGNITIDETNTLEDIENNNFIIHKIEEVLPYKEIIVDDDLEKKISNGVKLDNIYEIEDKVIFKNKDNKLLGIYEKQEDSLVVWKNFI